MELEQENINGASVITRTKEAIYIRIPRTLQHKCSAGCCCGAPDCHQTWDTLMVPIKAPKNNGTDYCMTVHMPQSVVQRFSDYCAKQVAKA